MNNKHNWLTKMCWIMLVFVGLVGAKVHHWHNSVTINLTGLLLPDGTPYLWSNKAKN